MVQLHDPFVFKNDTKCVTVYYTLHNTLEHNIFKYFALFIAQVKFIFLKKKSTPVDLLTFSGLNFALDSKIKKKKS